MAWKEEAANKPLKQDLEEQELGFEQQKAIEIEQNPQLVVAQLAQ